MDARPWQRALPWATAAFLFGWLLWFCLPGLSAYFIADDMMNIYNGVRDPLWDLVKQNVLFFTGALRPFGVVFYRIFYNGFGLNPLPYRVGCLVLVFINVGLTYLVAREVCRSRGTAALATLFGAYHAPFADIYYATSVAYDLLSFLFYFASFLAWARWRNWWACAILLVLALNSKEIAISLPVALLAFELFIAEPRRWTGIWVSGLVTVAYLAGKIFSSDSMLSNPSYQLQFNPGFIATNWAHYVKEMFWGYEVSAAFAAGVMVALLAIAFFSRRPSLRWAWTVMVAGALPVVIIEPRSLYAIYVTLPAWAVYAADLLHFLMRDRWKPVTFVLVAALLGPMEARATPMSLGAVNEAMRWAREPVEQLRRTLPSYQPGATVLFLDDPYPADDWILTFIFRLLYRQMDINVDRIKRMEKPPAEAELARYTYLFNFKDYKLQRLR